MKPFRAVSPRIPAEIPAMDANDVRLFKKNVYNMLRPIQQLRVADLGEIRGGFRIRIRGGLEKISGRSWGDKV